MFYLFVLLGYFNLGKVYSQLNNLDDAIICFEKVIELNSTLIESYSSLASCLIRKKESQLAIKWCKKVFLIFYYFFKNNLMF